MRCATRRTARRLAKAWREAANAGPLAWMADHRADYNMGSRDLAELATELREEVTDQQWDAYIPKPDGSQRD